MLFKQRLNNFLSNKSSYIQKHITMMGKYADLFIIITKHIKIPSQNNERLAKEQASYQNIDPKTDKRAKQALGGSSTL